MNFLVLCNNNSSESIAFESIMNHRAMGRVTAYSASPEPADRLPTKLVDLILMLGHDPRDLEPKHWNGFLEADAPTIDLVLSLCSELENYTMPDWPGKPVLADWSHLFPVEISLDGPQATVDLRKMIEILTGRVDKLLELPLETMSRPALVAEFQRIGAQP